MKTTLEQDISEYERWASMAEISSELKCYWWRKWHTRKHKCMLPIVSCKGCDGYDTKCRRYRTG